MRAVVLCCALVLAAAAASSAMGVDRASLQQTLRRDYPAGTRVSQLPLHLRVAIAQAAVATDAAANELALEFALAADASDDAATSESAFRFASAEVGAEAAETLQAVFEAPQLETAAQRLRFRAMKAALMAEAASVVRARAGVAEADGPLSLFGGGGGGDKKKDKPLMNTGLGSVFGKVADKAKSVAHSTPIVGDVVKRAEQIDIHKLSGGVAKVAGAVNTVSGALSPVLAVGTAATAAVPVVGEVMAAATVANTAVGVGSGVVATGAQLIHDNTKEGETLGHALGRAKDYAVAVGNDPTKLARDAVGLIRRKIAECKRDPSICVKLGLTVGSMAASIAGQGGLSKGMKLGASAIGIAQKIKAADDQAAGKAKGAKRKAKGKANAKTKGRGKGAVKGGRKRTGKGRAKPGKAKPQAKASAAKANAAAGGLNWAAPDASAQQQQQKQQQKPDVLSAVQQIMA